MQKAVGYLVSTSIFFWWRKIQCKGYVDKYWKKRNLFCETINVRGTDIENYEQGCIDIWIDEIVPCLKDTTTGEMKKTVVFKIESQNI